MKSGYVYILSNFTRSTFYIGVTSHPESRILEHKKGDGSKFTSKYKTTFLMYLEQLPNMNNAIQREKQLKNWRRNWKINLIKSQNPEMVDQAGDWYSEIDFLRTSC